MAPVRSYTNWNSRTTDEEEQIEPYRKYFFICEGANTETWYFKKLIDIRKELNIHPLIDIRLLEKTEGDRDISFPRRLIEFAEDQKENPEISFDKEQDKMILNQMQNRLSRTKKMDIRHLSISCYLPEQESIRRRILQLESW